MDEKTLAVAVTLMLLINLAGCRVRASDTDGNYVPDGQGRTEGTGDLESMQDPEKTDALADSVVTVQADSKIGELEKGLSAVRYEGEDGLSAFLSGGGAKTDGEVVQFLAGSLFAGNQSGFTMNIQGFGCSTLSVQNTEGGYFFGRNFDWNACDALVITSYPQDGYASVSTVNLDFIRQGAGMAADINYFHLLWNLYRLKRNAGRTKEQIEGMQKRKLEKLLLYAYDCSPYYRRAFEAEGIFRENIGTTPLAKFPVLDKEILMEHFDELVTDRGLKQEELLKFDENSSVKRFSKRPKDAR